MKIGQARGSKTLNGDISHRAGRKVMQMRKIMGREDYERRKGGGLVQMIDDGHSRNRALRGRICLR